MPLRRGELRYAHSDGHCDVTFDGSGQMLTGGSEGDVRIWREEDGDLEAESHRIGDRVMSLVVVGDKLYSAIENNTVQVNTLPECEPDGLATRFTGQVNHLALSGDQRYLAAGAGDFTVKVLAVDNHSKQWSLTGHSAPVLSVALNYKGEYCASSSCDGTVKIWRVSDEKCVHTIDNVLKKCSDVNLAKTLCRLVFQGQNLLVPIGKEVHQYNKEWVKIRSFECENDVSIVCFSHCGKYMAASTVDGKIRVWKFDTKAVIVDEKHENNRNITALKWHPKKYQLTYCDSSGHFGQFDDVIDEEAGDEGLTTEQYDNLFDSGDEDDFSKIYDKAAEKNKKDVDEDDMMDEGDINDVLAEMSGGESDSEAPPRMVTSPTGSDSRPASPEKPPPVVHDCYKPTALQRPFQSRSTPQHLAQRFMVWNNVGIVRQYRYDDENTIDAEFHDSSVHHRLTVVNDLDHNLADISAEAVVLANDDTLVCMHFSSWDNTKEWSISMPKGESITALALGTGFIVIGTDKRQVRVFSIGGIQTRVFSVAGPVLTLAAHMDKFAVVYHSGMGVPGDQCLSMKLINAETNYGLDTPLPLSPKTSLSFVGFSDEGGIFAMDSHGIVRMLNEKYGQTWVQVCHTGEHTKGKLDNYWIVGISESQYNIRCILCKGATYPPVLPRPALSLIPWKVPLCADEKAMIEENYFRSQLSQNFLREIQNEDLQKASDLLEREALMKLFALSCKQGHEFRAFEVCRLMPDHQTVQLAIKYASKLHFMTLAERLNDLAREKMDEEIAKMRQEDEKIVDVDEDIENTKPDDDEEDVSSGPMLVLKSRESTPKSAFGSPSTPQSIEPRNPFKTSKMNVHTKGAAVFDEIKKGNKPSSGKQTPFGRAAVELKPAPIKRSKQKTLLSSVEPKVGAETKTAVEPKVSAFDLWYQSVKEEMEEEFPAESNEERAKIAVGRFRELSREEKKVWMEKAKNGDGKRKRENSEECENKKMCA